MVIKDANFLRSLLALKGLYKQVDIAEALDMTPNSIVRLFKGHPVHRGTARRVARLVERDVNELFKIADND